MKKILCLCDAGEVRSVAMAKVLRERGHFAVAGSYVNYVMSHGGLGDFLMSDMVHFDKEIYMQEGGEHFIGRDEQVDIDNPELREKCIELAERLGL